MTGLPRIRSWSEVGRLVILVFAAFAAFTALSWDFRTVGGPSFFYPAAGVTVSAMILSRRAAWPWIAAAVVAAELLADVHYGTPVRLSLYFAAANVVESVVGAGMVVAVCAGRPDLRRRRDFAVFVAGACLVGPAFGALIGGTAACFAYGQSWLGEVAGWWAGDALSILVIASPILLWPLQSSVLRRRPWETVVVLIATAALSVTALRTGIPPSVVILPVLVWAAFRLDMLGAATAGALASFLADILDKPGPGLLGRPDESPEVQLVLAQVYVAVIVVVAMLIAQESAARLNAVREREAERRERIQLETLSRLARRLSAALTPEDISNALRTHVLDEAGARAVNLYLVSPLGDTLDLITTTGHRESLIDRYGRGVPLGGRSVAGDVVRDGAAVDIRTAAAYARAYPELAEWPISEGVQTVVGRPLVCGADTFGAMVMLWSDPQPLDSAQRAYISAVATMVSQALVRARVYVDERERASVLQSVAQPPARVDAVGLEYRALYRSADASNGLGGDWYSVLTLDGDRTYLAVGDVLGHGLTAVEDMAQLRIAGNAYAYLGFGPAQLLGQTGRYAGRISGAEFATATVGVYDATTGVLSYSSAGHPPPLLRRSATAEVIRLAAARGPVLGLMDDAGYTESSVRVEDGDVLVMYTDGLVEHGESEIQSGIEHFERVIADWPPEALLDCEALAEAVVPTPRTDDICLVIVRFGTGAQN
ncbi:MAG TPA: SpoIIE family protein phosphatase [Mycobacterium sp.]|nr:SpoIIE family protein phosphatase [Mycobacterium sp.]HQE14893.1 SpoIIE family protein phosphatase [Mycobacterium sp.]